MVLYTEAVITATITTTIIINTKSTESKKFPNILWFWRSIPFQSQLKIRYNKQMHYEGIIYIYCIISSNWHRISLWREGDRERPPFCTTFQKSLLLNVPPLFSPSIKINLPHFFFMFPPAPSWSQTNLEKSTAHREILQKFILRFAFSGAQSWLIWKKLVGISYFNKKQCLTTSKISDSVCYCIDHISLLYLPKIMSPLVPHFLSNMSPV